MEIEGGGRVRGRGRNPCGGGDASDLGDVLAGGGGRHVVAVDVVAHGAGGDAEAGGCLAVGEGVVFNPRAQLRGTVGEGFAVIDEVGVEARAAHFGAQLGDLALSVMVSRRLRMEVPSRASTKTAGEVFARG